MVPRKLAELFFAQWWILLAPVILTPLLVMIAVPHSVTYQARATVWVGNAPIGPSPFGEGLPYNTRAQNQAQVVNDLLATDSFRARVAESAGLVSAAQDSALKIRTARTMVVWAGTVGINVVTINAQAADASVAAAIVAGVVDEDLVRATEEAQRRADITKEYYTQQLAIAQQELDTRQRALNAYMADHPGAANPASSQALDLDFAVLRASVEDQQSVIDALNDSLQSADRELASAPQSQEAAFALQDAPLVPSAPLPVSFSTRVGLPAAGLVLGLILCGTYFVVRYHSDHSIRSAEDLAGLQVPLLASVKEVRPTGTPWWFSPEAASRRRAWLTFAKRSAAGISTKDQPDT